MENDKVYQSYATFPVKDVPYENLDHLIEIFMDKASMNMGSDFNDRTLKGTIEIIKQYFSYIPVCYVASAFIQGSLGKYGAGRLVPRTIHGWLTEAVVEYNQVSAHKRQGELAAIPFQAVDLRKYPFGKAIIKKIEWDAAGLLDENWEKVPLQELAGLIGAGHQPTLEHFGIQNNLKS